MSALPVPPRPDPQRYSFFFDLDGTLAPITDKPSQAAVPAVAISLLDRLSTSTGGAVAILSGRPLNEIDKMVGPLVLPAAGSHGVETRPAVPMPSDDAAQGSLQKAHDALRVFARQHDLLLERKPGAVALHYRGAEALAEDCIRLVDLHVSDAPSLRAMHGKLVSEVALAGINKGVALRALSALPAFAGRHPIMIGDDVTDEDGMRVANEMGGFGIRIGAGETLAGYSLGSPAELLVWLKGLTQDGNLS